VGERAVRHYQTTVRCAWEAQAILGEGPVWDTRSQALHFVDIKGADLLSFREKGVRRIRPVAGGISAVFLTCTRRLLCATTRGLVLAEYGSGGKRLLTSIESGRSGNRTNDGKCDALGRVWIGTMDASEQAFTGALYRIGHDASVTLVLDDIGVSNGLDWSPDGKIFYYTDSKRRLIWRFPFDMESGNVGPREVFAEVPDGHGVPDGLTVDAEGFVWSAHWDGWRVTRYDPAGKVERVVWLPVPLVTSLCFGGSKLDTLYITSARIGLDYEQLVEAPLSGSLFSCQPGVIGLPPNHAKVDPVCSPLLRGARG
jgi:sugar lactone lactonase YvrE